LEKLTNERLVKDRCHKSKKITGGRGVEYIKKNRLNGVMNNKLGKWKKK